MDAEPTGLIVAGVNDSPASREAVRTGAREAARRGCRLELVHAFNWEPAIAPEGGLGREELLERAVADARDAAPGVPIETRLFEGSAEAGLLSRSRVAALTVIGDGGLHDRTCLPLEALTVQVAARAAGTVLVTPAAAPEAGPVVVGVNASATAEQALEFAFDSAAGRDAGLMVVRAWDRDGEEDPRATLLAAVGPLESRYGLRACVRVVEDDPCTALRTAAQGAGLVVVGARGRHPYAGLLGWVAQTLLHHSSAPVALVRGHAACSARPPLRETAQSSR
ncbi:nucleotide-binding universal stress UspA family protein [Actinoplanes campanulatus]|uniref:Nucleotide-binding universal stress UspA family protein n=1 Tax=Actinoplanes campanulatus TaxID=113559 RepID=A0A7W5AG55_9ACTN|nr:universal stress protein [Actinoplanes campanulatus]MBB3095450.1 nucleotide-binding universal stress UspA family protein [Actinoplanes campanulatus]GGN09075.1 universal stress protein [Actinoplanes campanulatus]GID36335.1 universal stress protein [Actinoplanes campanulatus]